MSDAHRIIYGTMRMLEIKRTLSKWTYIFDEMYEKGISNFHISREYKSYSLFLEVIKNSKFKKKDFNVYAKCFSPNFNEKNYEKKVLLNLVNNYLNDLNINKINMQWMWRSNINNDQVRCLKFKESVEKINFSFIQLKKNKIKDIFCFPYSLDFGKLVAKIPSINGLMIYYNPKEKSFKKILGKNNIGIRPLFAGRLDKKFSFEHLMNFSLKEKKISKTVLSLNRLKNFKALYSYLNV